METQYPNFSPTHIVQPVHLLLEIQELLEETVQVVEGLIMEIVGGGMPQLEKIIIARHGQRWREENEQTME